ncbi:MAG: septum formation family protein [Actinomycetota bacterium]|nr:septum formation family protein [Actinomycetota bacterium]
MNLIRRPAATAAALLMLNGCASSAGSTHSAQEQPAGAPSPSKTASSTPTPVPAAPVAGSCHRLTFAAATQPTDSSTAVPCSEAHTAQTIYVGTLGKGSDGNLLAVESAQAQGQILRACPRSLGGFLGGSRTTRRLSAFQVVGFSPTPEQGRRGAQWFRCDAVALRRAGHLALLPTRLHGVLNSPAALTRFGTCGTAAPGSAHFHRVMCSQRHTWRAVEVVPLDPGARYLGPAAGTVADDRCKAVAATRANGALRYAWSFEWPTRTQWHAGRRYGLCWLPGA